MKAVLEKWLSSLLRRMPEKPRILMYWGYHRKAWTLPFEAISDKFDFIYLFHFNQENEILNRPELSVRYFCDFSSIQDIFQKLTPQKVVFLGLDGLLSLMINFEAQKRNIQTLVIQHGFLYRLEDQITEYYQERISKNTEERSLHPQKPQSDRKYTYDFLFKSLRTRNVFFFVRVFLNKFIHRKKSEHEQMIHLSTKQRLANRYLLYAPYFGDLYIQRDGVTDRIEFIGNPEFDEVLQEASNHDTNNEEPYLLHIDQPILHPYKLGQFAKYSKERGQEFYIKLSELAQGKRLKLKVKLHPYSYDYLDLYPHNHNIQYIDDHPNLAQLIKEASFVTGFYSTLLLPAIFLKPTMVFELTPGATFFRDLKNTYQVSVASMDISLKESMGLFDETKPIKSDLFVRDFFFRNDDQSINRLKLQLGGA